MAPEKAPCNGDKRADHRDGERDGDTLALAGKGYAAADLLEQCRKEPEIVGVTEYTARF